MTALLDLSGVGARYGAVDALRGVSLTVAEGEAVAVLGANGAGKTTLLRAVSGTVRRSGTIRFAGRDVSRAAAPDLARLGVAHVPEGRGTFTELSVRDNLRLGAYARRDRAAVREDEERVAALFPRLAVRGSQAAGTLSGGEQQMLALGRALMGRPRLLMLDEPSLGLAPLVVREIFRILAERNREDGLTLLLVEQNAALALELASRALVLEAGSPALAGTSDELRADDTVRRLYLGN